jgi:hypothetical protein
MKTLQERMNDMKPYFRAIEVYNNALMVRMVLPTNWKIYPSSDGRIKVTPSETNANEAIYYADSNEASYEDIFDLIEDTIKNNRDIVSKLKLLKEKIEELKELFSTHSFEELETLRFELIEPKKTKGKRKYTKRKKEAENEAEATQIEEEIPQVEEDNKVEEIVEGV